MERVVARRLEHAEVLEEGNDGAIFGAGAVGPFVDLVGVDADRDEEPELPREDAEPRGGTDEGGTDEDEIPRALPPRKPREETRVVMVHDIRANEVRADDRSFDSAIGVFEPVDDAGEKIGEHDEAEDLGEGEECGAHGRRGFSTVSGGVNFLTGTR